MATAAVPYTMEYGGYDQKDLLKAGWLYSIIGCLISVGWIMTIMPVL
jgi:di/tricarboxylate transporter